MPKPVTDLARTSPLTDGNGPAIAPRAFHLKLLSFALALGFLWFTLINHLRIDWTVNPQYNYGWAVPFLCAYLIWRRLTGPLEKVERRKQKAEVQTKPGDQGTEGPESSILNPQSSIHEGRVENRKNTRVDVPIPSPGGEGQGEGGTSVPWVSGLESRKQKTEISAFQHFSISAFSPVPWSLGPLVFWSLVLCLLAYAPTRLIQEANPEWRLISWALALEVIAITLLTLRLGESRKQKAESRNSELRTPNSEPRRSSVRSPGGEGDGEGGISVAPVSVVEIGKQKPRISASQHLSVSDFAPTPTLQHSNTPIPSPGGEGQGEGGTSVPWVSGLGSRKQKPEISAFQPFSLSAFVRSISAFSFQISDFIFPLCFFLVAVPWPTLIEAPLIQALSKLDTSCTVDFLGFFGIPAIQHGNIIEIGSGAVGVDDACSGIRSFQATLMLSLFFGEFYRLTFFRRLVSVLAGFAFSIIFNLGRTLLLVYVGSSRGINAISHWHDPAGTAILVLCFLSLWLLARLLRPPTPDLRPQTSDSAFQNVSVSAFPSTPPLHHSKIPLSAPGGEGKGEVALLPTSDLRPPASDLHSLGLHRFDFRFQNVSVSAFLLLWLLAVELGTEAWYRYHEHRLPPPITWNVQFPRDNPTFREINLSPTTRQILRYDEGTHGTWQEIDGTVWQTIFLRWNPGRIAVHLAKGHTPESCLTAAGRELISRSDVGFVPVNGLALPFRSYLIKDESGPLHVFYCLWDDRATARSFRATRLTYANRLAPVLAGRRNSGQRSLEVAVAGFNTSAQAEAALQRELEKLVTTNQ